MRTTRLHTTITTVAALAVLAAPTVASASGRDRDHDHMPDRWEHVHHLNTHDNDARRDADHDGLPNLAEFQAQTDPRDADTDGDGTTDQREQAGTVTSFTDGVLTLTLFDGSTLVATVDRTTEIECALAPATAPAPAPAALRHHGRNGDQDENGHATGRRGREHRRCGDRHRSCGTSDLIPGARVDEAVISITSAGRMFRKVQLG